MHSDAAIGRRANASAARFVAWSRQSHAILPEKMASTMPTPSAMAVPLIQVERSDAYHGAACPPGIQLAMGRNARQATRNAASAAGSMRLGNSLSGVGCDMRGSGDRIHARKAVRGLIEQVRNATWCLTDETDVVGAAVEDRPDACLVQIGLVGNECEIRVVPGAVSHEDHDAITRELGEIRVEHVYLQRVQPVQLARHARGRTIEREKQDASDEDSHGGLARWHECRNVPQSRMGAAQKRKEPPDAQRQYAGQYRENLEVVERPVRRVGVERESCDDDHGRRQSEPQLGGDPCKPE